MSLSKYILLPEGEDFAAGHADLQDCLNLPLDVGGCTIFICKKGNADISLNFKHHQFKAGQVLISIGGTIIIPVHVSADFSVFRISLSIKAVDEILYKNSSELYDFFHSNPILSATNEQRPLLEGLERQVLWILKPEHTTNAYKMLSNALSNFFLAIECIAENAQLLSVQNYKMNRAWVLINDFAKLLLAHCHANRNVSFYADKLCITPCYLYKVVTKELAISPKEMIDYYVVSKLKILLSTTNMSVNEIAEKLNFDDPSYLNRFFQRQAGVTLSQFRSDHAS